MKKIGWGILGAARVNERLMPAIAQSDSRRSDSDWQQTSWCVKRMSFKAPTRI